MKIEYQIHWHMSRGEVFPPKHEGSFLLNGFSSFFIYNCRTKRFGERSASCRMRACCSGPYFRCGPGLGKSSKATSLTVLKRLVTLVTGPWLFHPTRRAVSLKLFPSETARSAMAR